MKKIIQLLLLFFVCNGNAQNLNYHLTDNQLVTKIDSIVHVQASEIMKDNSMMGMSVGIYINNEAHFYNYGTIEKGKQQLPNSNTIYEIGSITKTFTGILLANAVLEDKINLDDDIRNYLTGDYNNLQYDGTPIKIINLANHTSGLPEDIIPEEFTTLDNPTMFDIINIYKGDTLSMFIEGLEKVEIGYLPGSKIKYSNAGIIVLGIILENVYGISYSDLIKKYITVPLEMNHTETVCYSSDTANYTKGYSKQGNIMPHITFQIAAAAGGLKSTANDLLKYVKENILEKDDAIKLSHKRTIELKNQVLGLGWQIKTNSKNNTVLWHDGGEPGFSSYCQIIPEKNIGIVCLANQRGCQFQFSQLSNNIIAGLIEN